MHHLWIILVAAVGFVAAFINDTLPQLGSLVVDGLQPATGAGWDNEADFDFSDELLDDDTWENFKCKGNNLVQAMNIDNFNAAKLFSSIQPTAESPWDNFGKNLRHTLLFMLAKLNHDRQSRTLGLAPIDEP